MTEKSKIIDWKEAMETVGNDREFLVEVLEELLKESNAAFENIKVAIKNKDYNTVYKEAHRVKGSASYLFCVSLRDYAMDLQDIGAAANKCPSEEMDQDVRALFGKCTKSLNELEDEFRRWSNK